MTYPYLSKKMEEPGNSASESTIDNSDYSCCTKNESTLMKSSSDLNSIQHGSSLNRNSHDRFVPGDEVPANDVDLGKKVKSSIHEPTALSPPRLEDEHSLGKKGGWLCFAHSRSPVLSDSMGGSSTSATQHHHSFMGFRFPTAYYDESIQSFIEDLYTNQKRNEKDERLHWRKTCILGAMCVLYMASSLSSSCFGILMNDVRGHFSAREHVMGVMSAMITLGYALVQPFVGLVVLILGPWKAVVISTVITITGNIGFGLSNNFRVADMFRLLTGLGCGMVYGIVWWFVKSEINPNKFGKLSAVLEISNAVGTVVATLPVYYFVRATDWTYLFTVVQPSIVLIGGFVASALLLPYKTQLMLPISSLKNELTSDLTLEMVENAETSCDNISLPLYDISITTVPELEEEVSGKRVNFVTKGPKRVEICSVSERNAGSECDSEASVAHRGMVRIRNAFISWESTSEDILSCANEWGAFGIGFAVMGLMDALGFTWLVTVLEQLHGLTYEQAGICVMVSNMMVIPVIYFAGVVSDHINLRLPFVCIGIFFAMLHVIFLGFLKLTFHSAICVCALNGFSQGFTSTSYAFAAESLSAKHTEQAVAWNQLFYMGGVTCMTSIIGVVIEKYNTKIACLCVLVVLCLSCIPIPFLRETHGIFQEIEKTKSDPHIP